MDCSPPGSSVHGILQARVLERAAISFSMGASRPRDGTWISRTVGRFFTIWTINYTSIVKKKKKKNANLIYFFAIFKKKKRLVPLSYPLIHSTLSAFVPFKCIYWPIFSDLKPFPHLFLLPHLCREHGYWGHNFYTFSWGENIEFVAIFEKSPVSFHCYEGQKQISKNIKGDITTRGVHSQGRDVIFPFHRSFVPGEPVTRATCHKALWHTTHQNLQAMLRLKMHGERAKVSSTSGLQP